LNSNNHDDIIVTETIDSADAKDFRILSAYLMTADTTKPPNADEAMTRSAKANVAAE
jgi:hypothetical protein